MNNLFYWFAFGAFAGVASQTLFSEWRATGDIDYGVAMVSVLSMWAMAIADHCISNSCKGS